MACNPKSEFEVTDQDLSSVPDSVLKVETMIEVMTDIHLAEAWVIEQKNDSIANDVKLESYYAGIYSNYGISAQHYKSSFTYYAQHPALMNYIYIKVTEKLNLLESQNRHLGQPKNTNLKNEQKSK